MSLIQSLKSGFSRYSDDISIGFKSALIAMAVRQLYLQIRGSHRSDHTDDMTAIDSSRADRAALRAAQAKKRNDEALITLIIGTWGGLAGGLYWAYSRGTIALSIPLSKS